MEYTVGLAPPNFDTIYISKLNIRLISHEYKILQFSRILSSLRCKITLLASEKKKE